MAFGAAVIQGHRAPPPLPAEAVGTWQAFQALSSARGAMQPIGFQDIDAYCRLTGDELSPWDIDQVRALDVMALQIWADKATKKPTKSRVAGTDAAGIDRVLGRVGRHD